MRAAKKQKSLYHTPSYEDVAKIKKVDISALSKISLPLSLNQYFAPFIENIKDCLLFLERFIEDDESIARLIKTYNTDKAFSKTSDSLDLDLLAKKSDFSTGELRRLLYSTMDVLGDEEAMMLLRNNKKHLVKKSLEIALTDAHPDSFEERRSLMQYYGFHPIPKGSQVLVNIDKSQNITQQNAVINNNNLPSFASTISNGQKIASQQMKHLIDNENNDENEDIENKQKLLEAQPISISIPTYTDKSPIEIEAEKIENELDLLKDLDEKD